MRALVFRNVTHWRALRRHMWRLPGAIRSGPHHHHRRPLFSHCGRASAMRPPTGGELEITRHQRSQNPLPAPPLHRSLHSYKNAAVPSCSHSTHLPARPATSSLTHLASFCPSLLRHSSVAALPPGAPRRPRAFRSLRSCSYCSLLPQLTTAATAAAAVVVSRRLLLTALS